MTQMCQSKIYLGFESSSLPRPTKMSFQKVSWWHVNLGTSNNLAVTTRGFQRLHKPSWEHSKSLAPGTQGTGVRLLVVAQIVEVSINKDVLHKTYCHIFGCYIHIPNTRFDNTVQNISDVYFSFLFFCSVFNCRGI